MRHTKESQSYSKCPFIKSMTSPILPYYHFLMKKASFMMDKSLKPKPPPYQLRQFKSNPLDKVSHIFKK